MIATFFNDTFRSTAISLLPELFHIPTPVSLITQPPPPSSSLPQETRQKGIKARVSKMVLQINKECCKMGKKATPVSCIPIDA